MSKKNKVPAFVEIHKGATLNSSLIVDKRSEFFPKDKVKKYYVVDAYGIEHEVNRTRYNYIVKTLGL